eukprot:TRINITY_DN386_c1_g1_i1.p1 TRINITY_DN386_c1_g1~~TRINITY_DN386_c1_g1_i1.p1  ORF type:complete len:694 (+),score=62.98 TRINITY_DN386_c1_g1_i1:129-2084(+)
MAGYGADLDETPRWRLSVLFMVIVVLSLGAHIGLHSLQEYFRRQKRKGLKHTLQTLTDELFALGLITLILIVCQDQLIKICIDGDSGSSDYDKYTTKNRKLLAGYSDFKCPKGQESLWSITALHEIHILIFIIAVVHLAQAAFSMIISELRVRRWKKYEDRENHNMVPLKRTGAIKIKGSWIVLYIQSFFTQFTDSIDGPVYLAIRRLFIEKMELDDDFNFYDFVVDSMEEGFAKMVEFQWLMWLIAAVWILIPWQAWSVIWLPCLFLAILLVVGAKLQSVAIQLASLAYTHFTPQFIAHKNRSHKSGFLKRKSRSITNILAMYNNGKEVSTPRQVDDVEMDDVEKSSQRPSLGTVSVVGNQTPRLGTISVADPSKVNKPKLQFDETVVETPRGESQTAKKSNRRKSNSQLAVYLAQTRLLKDSSQLFWFGKPKLMRNLFQYIYFQSGLIIAFLILDEWRGQTINHLSGHAVYIIMIGVNLLIMIHAALFVIPTYAITVAAGAYGPDNVLKKAMRRNVNPKLAKRLDLERKSMTMTSVQDSYAESIDMSVMGDDQSVDGHVEEPEHHDDEHGDDHGHGHGHGHDGGSHIKTLLQAMESSQVRKKKLEELDVKEASECSGKYYKNDGKSEPVFQETIDLPHRPSQDISSSHH